MDHEILKFSQIDLHGNLFFHVKGGDLIRCKLIL